MGAELAGRERGALAGEVVALVFKTIQGVHPGCPGHGHTRPGDDLRRQAACKQYCGPKSCNRRQERADKAPAPPVYGRGSTQTSKTTRRHLSKPAERNMGPARRAPGALEGKEGDGLFIKVTCEPLNRQEEHLHFGGVFREEGLSRVHPLHRT